MQIFSPNMLKVYEECPKKYEYRYVQKFNVPQSKGVFEKGKKIHALAHYYLRGDDIQKLLAALTDDEYLVWKSLLNNEYFQKNYVNSEYNLTTKVGDFWIGGRLDAFMKSDNNYFILDYKTGAVPKNPSEDYQTMVYLICANEVLAKGWGNNYSLSFVYIDLKNNQNHKITFDTEKKTHYYMVLENACKKITTTRNFLKNQNRCNFCEYSKFCH